jgi:acetylornithine deacetylase/succinyl-diaminopimelate desuccinylase-like protein
MIITDSHWMNENPVIYCGTRGQQSITIIYHRTDMEENLHAGNYGGIQAGAAREFIDILAGILHEIDELIAINPTMKEQYANAVSLTNIFSGDPQRSAIPKAATAKIDIRYTDIAIPLKVEQILNHVKEVYGIDYVIEQNEEGFYNTPNQIFLGKMQTIIRVVTKREPCIRKYNGAYLSMRKMHHLKGTKYVLPFAQADENNHAPNENISIKHISYGMDIVEDILTR